MDLSYESLDPESLAVTARHFYTTLNAPITTPGENTPDLEVEDPEEKAEKLNDYLKQGGIEELETA